MKPLHRIILLVIVALTTATLAYLVVKKSQTRPKTRQGTQTTQKKSAETTIRSAEMTYAEGGKLRWKAIIDQMELEHGGKVTAHDLREGIIYNDKQQPALHVKAERIKGSTARRDFQAIGDVVVTSPKGFVIRAKKVDWLNDSQKIHCSDAVRMKANDLIITSNTMNYLLRPNLIKCPKKVYLYSKDNQVEGTNLVYSVSNEQVRIHNVEMIINPEQAKEIIREWENE